MWASGGNGYVDLRGLQSPNVRHRERFPFFPHVVQIQFEGFGNVLFGFFLQIAKAEHAGQFRDIGPPLIVFLHKDYLIG
jgi:hypothetical protein